MNKKWTSVLLISAIIITGFIILFPDNLIDLKIMSIELGENKVIYNFFYYLTFLGSRMILIPFVIIGSVYLYLKFKSYQPSLVFISGTLSSYILNELIKAIIKRDRPSILEQIHATGYSFPSGHAMISAVCYGIFIFYLFKIIKGKRKRQLLILFTIILLLLIGYSRIVLEVHYFTDVLGGYLIGSLFINLYFKIIKHITQRRELKYLL